MKRTNAKRRRREKRQRRYRDQYGGPWPNYDHAGHIRSLPCLVSISGGCYGPTEAAHTERRSRNPGDPQSWQTIVPLCRKHHSELDVGCAGDLDRFKRKFFVDLGNAAAVLAAEADGIYRPRDG